jgi:hypothetical protein
MNKRWLWTCLLDFSVQLPVRAGELRAGVALVAITSAREEFPYANQGDRDFVGVHDEVYARASAR